MSERVYMVEQLDVTRARVLSCCATYGVAKAEIERLLDTMPKGPAGSHGRWKQTRTRKRDSPNHGRTEMVWHCGAGLVVGPSTKHIRGFAIFSMVVKQGIAVDRLGELASG